MEPDAARARHWSLLPRMCAVILTMPLHCLAAHSSSFSLPAHRSMPRRSNGAVCPVCMYCNNVWCGRRHAHTNTRWMGCQQVRRQRYLDGQHGGQRLAALRPAGCCKDGDGRALCRTVRNGGFPRTIDSSTRSHKGSLVERAGGRPSVCATRDGPRLENRQYPDGSRSPCSGDEPLGMAPRALRVRHHHRWHGGRLALPCFQRSTQPLKRHCSSSRVRIVSRS
jgi:hypothetical protein